MLFGGSDRSKPEFYPVTESPLPSCFMGYKAPLTGHSSGDTLRNPVLIRNPGTLMFDLLAVHSKGSGIRFLKRLG